MSLDKHLAWKDGTILFERATMAEATDVLGRWFNASFVFENEAIKNCIINGEFKNDQLSNILENLRFLTNLEYVVKPGNQIIVSGNSCN